MARLRMDLSKRIGKRRGHMVVLDLWREDNAKGKPVIKGEFQCDCGNVVVRKYGNIFSRNRAGEICCNEVGCAYMTKRGRKPGQKDTKPRKNKSILPIKPKQKRQAVKVEMNLFNQFLTGRL